MRYFSIRKITMSIFAGLFVMMSMVFLYGHLHAQSSVMAQDDTSISGDALHNTETAVVHSPAGGIGLPVSVQNSSDITVLFGGDMMFDRYIREVGEKRGYDFVFANMHETLLSYDRVIANLEGPITSQPSVSVGSQSGEPRNYVFTFDQKITQALWDNNIRIVNLGNNHILNFGEEGLSETRHFLSQSGIDFFGDPKDVSHRVVIETVKGVKIALVNYDQFVDGGSAVSVMNDIRAAKEQAAIVVVYTHWGKEYVAPPQVVKDVAHAMIEAGADAIIGSHPHIVQESEIYNRKKIYYSLGNFVFDQFFQDDTKRGLLVEMTIHRQDKSLSFRDIPIVLSANGQMSLK